MQVAAVRAGAGEQIAQNPAVAEKSQDQCPYHLKNLLDLKWYEEKGMVVCCLV